MVSDVRNRARKLEDESRIHVRYEPHWEKNLSLGFSTRSETNRAVQPQKMTGGFESLDLGRRGIVLAMK